jgi:carotenoid cleavage dioxygenase
MDGMETAPVPAYLEGNFAPVFDEVEASDLPVEGEIPRDLEGFFVRNGSNPRFRAPGRYHWFDGDGMIHAVQFEGGRASYRNRWVRTRAFAAEQEAGKALWTGVTERPDFTNPRGPFKDSANTDLIYHAGKLLALWWLGGEAYVVDLPSLETRGVETFGGKVPTLSAHPKLDPATGELLFFDYKPFPPYLTYGVADAEGRLTHHTTIDLPGPRLQHDMAITERHALFFDMSMMWDPELLKVGKTRVGYFRDRPSRIGVLPRHAPGDQVRWFEVGPFYMYHTVNAWDEGDRVVLLGCKAENPLVDDPGNPAGGPVVPAIGFLRLQPRLYRWILDLSTGKATEEPLDDGWAEFPRIDQRVMGRRSRKGYLCRAAAAPTMRFEALVKYDTDTGTRAAYEFPAGWYGSEAPFAPRRAQGAEDDGYLVSFVVEEATGRSEVFILDAARIEAGPVARVKLPARVPTGFHAWWVPAGEVARRRPA